MRDGGKGDTQRPLGVELEQFDNNWDAIFKKKDKLTQTEERWADIAKMIDDLPVREEK